MSTNYFAGSAFFNGLCAFFLVYYVYLRNKKNPLNQSFLYYGISVAGWSLIYSLWAWAKEAPLAEFYLRRQMMFAIMIPVTFFHFILHFTHTHGRYKRFKIGFYILGGLYAVGMLSNQMIAGVRPIMFFEFWPKPGPLLLSSVIYFFIVLAFAFTLLFQRLFKTSGIERKQTALVIAGCLIGFGGGCTNWFLWFDILIPPTTNFFVGVMFVIMAYGIVRYGLMDVDVIVEILRMSRSAAAGLVTASINHELRNPLFIAKGKIETQLDAVDRKLFSDSAEEAAKSRVTLEAALQQITRAMGIIQRFSDFLRPEVKTGISEETVEVRGVLDGILPLVSSEIELKNIRLDSSGVNGTKVLARHRDLEEILFNLVMNACQALGKSGGELSLKAREEGRSAVIEVADTGPGIPKEKQHRIFEPFYSTKKEKGQGLGLYITKQLVERNGGKISVASKPGRGTVFSVSFRR